MIVCQRKTDLKQTTLPCRFGLKTFCFSSDNVVSWNSCIPKWFIQKRVAFHVWPQCMIFKGNRIRFARFVLLAVSKEAKTWLPGLLHWRTRQWKNSWRQGLTNCTKRSTKVVKELLADYMKEKKRNWGNLRVGTNFENILCRSEKERIRSMHNKTIIRFGFCDIQNNQDLGKGFQPQPSASADNPYLDLDYSGYHKNLVQ